MCLLSLLPKRASCFLMQIGNGDKVLADSDSKVPDGDKTRNDLTKALASAKNTLNGTKLLLKAFSDAKVKAVNDAVLAKAQVDAKVAREAA